MYTFNWYFGFTSTNFLQVYLLFSIVVLQFFMSVIVHNCIFPFVFPFYMILFSLFFFYQRNHRITKPEMKASVQQLASRAASRAMSEAAKNVTPPTTAYQFEVSWRAFSGDLALQARLLKVYNFFRFIFNLIILSISSIFGID